MSLPPQPRQRFSWARASYLGLALCGLIFPARRYGAWLLENGFDVGALQVALTQTPITAGLTGTVFVVTTATVVFIVAECRARRDPAAMMCVPLTLLFGVAFGLPFYLYLRQRRRD
ncbi:MAG: DUF2834 domain-containing protein [Pseudomonadota bacterium]